MKNMGPADREPDTIATPEGDGEALPDEVLTPAEVAAELDGLETPAGSAPAAYDTDAKKPSGLLEAIDEVSRGKLQP